MTMLRRSVQGRVLGPCYVGLYRGGFGTMLPRSVQGGGCWDHVTLVCTGEGVGTILHRSVQGRVLGPCYLGLYRGGCWDHVTKVCTGGGCWDHVT